MVHEKDGHTVVLKVVHYATWQLRWTRAEDHWGGRKLGD